MAEKLDVGSIGWRDLTVPDAERLRDFYCSVVGWKAEAVEMDGYEDFNMVSPTSGESVAGICHARGVNADLPAQWLLYFVVDNLDRSVGECLQLGGTVLQPPRGTGGSRYCVIRDPAGAVCALFEVSD